MSAKVLIVEDEEAIVTLLTYNLEVAGFDVAVTKSGSDALVVIEEENPDLVILDWMLPGLAGIEVCRQIRARQKTKALPVIMLTARGEEGDRIRGLSVGADDYVVKPFSVTELMARVKALLRRSSPERIADQLEGNGLKNRPYRAPRHALRPRDQSRADGIPPARAVHGKSRPGSEPVAAARRRLGPHLGGR